MLYIISLLSPFSSFQLATPKKLFVLEANLCFSVLLILNVNYRNKTQKRVTAINRELPPPNEQFLFDFEQIQSQYPVSFQ